MVLLQYSSTIPQGEKSSGQLQVVNLIWTMFNVLISDQEENTESLQVKLA